MRSTQRPLQLLCGAVITYHSTHSTVQDIIQTPLRSVIEMMWYNDRNIQYLHDNLEQPYSVHPLLRADDQMILYSLGRFIKCINKVYHKTRLFIVTNQTKGTGLPRIHLPITLYVSNDTLSDIQSWLCEMDSRTVMLWYNMEYMQKCTYICT